MEKLFSIKKIGLIVALLAFYIMPAQNNYIVFKVEGKPIYKQNDSLKSIAKGSIININSRVTLKNSDSFLMIDKAGSLYNVDKTGDYAYTDL